ncbi:acetyl-CoA C-acyltransferase [Staphylococcus epidermidis]|uniref:acetyl-CoA C-acyltransferase n=1 Tax=Staphylococcus epidermidis TaxID=1282 RepID=UPI0011AA1A2E|nr:acetyl-CoA C-acyltransferase [Staphylococcus epidermidis]MBM0791077.1 acetyl-CoA C-acyltransferase [Staphylococcus epidermidis]MCG1164068.1 acetyl-CoA C-acyltransferase [Staphylococcus epidermidis]MCG1808025.1 acetyl-CoA C-acyltransferase [Staphylococcus epidermidis]MCG2041748.1 acetyl-CoA C-acyltransferase [Staphylococcus epidermidis]MCG2079678.1 acetyl-CoA C-acyltransferase [Staphylococcus epidermidis]
MKQPVIIAAKRIAFGKYGGRLKHLEPESLLEPLFNHFTGQYPKVMSLLDDVIIGNTVGNGGNLARKSLLEAGLDFKIPGITIDRQCGSGLEAVIQACRMVQSGAGTIYIAGGVESTSRAPWKIKRPQSVYESEFPQFFERAPFAREGEDPSMIEAAENVAKKYHISRNEQDDFAYRSHQLASKNMNNGNISQEILPFKVKGECFNQDESIKPQLTLKTLGRLKPLLNEGTVTVGNSCMKNDGAVLLIVMEENRARQLGFTEGIKFVNSATVGVQPQYLGVGPVPAVNQLLARERLTINDINAVELNEAFSSQVIASQQQLNIPLNKLNCWGGAIATGHPYGASGAALVTRLFYMKHQFRTVATMGIGGGIGNAALFERWYGN